MEWGFVLYGKPGDKPVRLSWPRKISRLPKAQKKKRVAPQAKKMEGTLVSDEVWPESGQEEKARLVERVRRQLDAVFADAVSEQGVAFPPLCVEHVPAFFFCRF